MKLFILLCLMALVAADFSEFKKKRGRRYKNAEQALEAEIHYKRHKKLFDEHNARFAAGEVSFTVGENDFSDQNNTEVIARLCKTVPPRGERAIQAPNTFPAGAASRDYTSQMQPIVNQGQCGSCWAFATIAQLESLYKRNSPAYSFVMSPQYLVDCSRGTNKGCDGGWPSTAMSTILSTGMPTAANYPYSGKQAAACRSPLPTFIAPKLPTQVNSYSLGGNEVLLKNIVSQDGPVVVAIYASNLFMSYRSGAFYDSSCPTNCAVNHAVVVVGYGTDAVGGDYWLVRNSWGTSWGLSGYIKMARNRVNNCSIGCYAMYMKK